MDPKIRKSLKQRKYFKYKRLCRIANTFNYDPNDVTSMLKYYDCLEKACKEREKFRDTIVPEEERDLGHEYQIEMLQEKLQLCQNRITYLLNTKKEVVENVIESDSEEEIESITDEVIESIVEESVDIDKENDAILDEAIANKNRDRKLVKIEATKLARNIHKLFDIKEDFEQWHDRGESSIYACIFFNLISNVDKLGVFCTKREQPPFVVLNFNEILLLKPDFRLEDLIEFVGKKEIPILNRLMIDGEFVFEYCIQQIKTMLSVSKFLFCCIDHRLAWDEKRKRYYFIQ